MVLQIVAVSYNIIVHVTSIIISDALDPNILNWSVSWFPTTLGQIEPNMSVSSFLLVSFGHLIS